MLIDFLSSCHLVDSCEKDDFGSLCCELSSQKLFVSYVPSVCLDLWPLYVLQCTASKCYSMPSTHALVYLMPIGALNFWAKPEFERLVQDFYQNDEFPSNRNIYGFDLEEMILLRYPGATEALNIGEIGSCNAVYMRMSRDQTESHIIAFLENPLQGWKTIVEHYGIKVDMLVDSNKGLGGWFADSRLYACMNATKQPMLLPQYYFKGKYISQPAPEGFSLLKEVDESGPHDCTTAIYKTPWYSNARE